MPTAGLCRSEHCRGLAIADGHCIGHAEPDQVEDVLAALRTGARFDLLRGVTVTRDLFHQVLHGVPHDPRGRPLLVRADLTGTIFTHAPRLDGVVFEGYANLTGARFARGARFGQAVFTHQASFARASFGELATFGGAVFEDAVVFSGAVFEDRARFHRARFAGPANFDKASFGRAATFGQVAFGATASFNAARFAGGAHFGGATFGDRARFHEAAFEERPVFDEATFAGDTDFSNATFERSVGLRGTRFQKDARFNATTWHLKQRVGSFAVDGDLVLDRTVFRERVLIQAAARTVSCRRARFEGGVRMLLRWADVRFTDTELPAPSLLGFARPFDEVDDAELDAGWWEERAAQAEGDDPARPRLLSVGGTDLSAVTVSSLDLRACRFLGSHNLDGLRVEGDTVFGYAPGGWRWTTRRTIAEEHHWRSLHARHRRREWYPPPVRSATPSLPPPTPRQIAEMYRALRKGLEDNKNEPGAADFYYGEMEMRRLDKRRERREHRRAGRAGPWAGAAGEYVLLWLYWLFSGYGLRAWRALSAFAAAVLLAAAAFKLYGFPAADPHGFGAALRFSLRASVSLLHDDNRDQPLTATGEWTELGLRLIGPLLLGLALLSLRGRVKR